MNEPVTEKLEAAQVEGNTDNGHHDRENAQRQRSGLHKWRAKHGGDGGHSRSPELRFVATGCGWATRSL